MQGYPKQILTANELADLTGMAYRQVPCRAESLPRDDQTDFTSLHDSNTAPCDDSSSITSKGDSTKRLPGEGTEDSSDSEASTTSFMLDPDPRFKLT